MRTSTTCTINVSLPSSLKEFVLAQVERGGYGSSSEYIRELIRDARTKAPLPLERREGPPSRRPRHVGREQKRPRSAEEP